MTATAPRPPDASQRPGAPTYPYPEAVTPPAPQAPARDVPWPDQKREDEPATITSTVAGVFAAFGIIAVLLLGLLLGSRLGNGVGRGASGSSGASAASTLDVTATEFKFAPAPLSINAPGKLTVN